MALKVSVKTNVVDKQTAYILYMMVGSYFRKCSCKSKMLEKQLFLYYKDMPVKKQESLEERVIKDTEKILEELLPVLAESDCTVRILKVVDGYQLCFESETSKIVLFVNEKGNYVWKL